MMWNAFGNLVQESFETIDGVTYPDKDKKNQITAYFFNESGTYVSQNGAQELRIAVPANTSYICFENCNNMIFRVQLNSLSTPSDSAIYYQSTFYVDSLKEKTIGGKVLKQFLISNPTKVTLMDNTRVLCPTTIPECINKQNILQPDRDFPITHDKFMELYLVAFYKKGGEALKIPKLYFVDSRDNVFKTQDFCMEIPQGTSKLALRYCEDMTVVLTGKLMDIVCFDETKGTYSPRNVNYLCDQGKGTATSEFKMVVEGGRAPSDVVFPAKVMHGKVIFLPGTQKTLDLGSRPENTA